MATHPVQDTTFKDDVLRRTLSLLTARTHSVNVPATNLYPAEVKYRTLRAVSLVCAAFAANVLENALVHLGYDSREAAFAKCDEMMQAFSVFPFLGAPSSASTPAVVGGGSTGSSAPDPLSNLGEISRLVRAEVAGGNELCVEVVSAGVHVFSRSARGFTRHLLTQTVDSLL